ncbi:macro domain-containing protein [Kineococcus radiotolerans]|uniref:Appr-1-p processing domain protein n=1 Tax=Kineococcus radiotolerans (strain ATCC BAA-149 / DSM 14245 / SRS30216) TaxID=266940 RepID=A6WGB8_KINRD|nr:macro domain-containing protein [Kineococcus radiotolerans]ABS05857.1 Appr-1-p processing domain protein [Kineococcus radiotolerans SRS30216 = ATCC BAA-149]
MALKPVIGDLFDLGLPALGHGCNCVGSMRGGIAVEFRRRWPEMHAAYQALCAAGDLQPGEVFPWVAEDVVVYNLATQQQSGADARLDAVERSVRAALVDAETRRLGALGVPRLGAGIGGLVWAEVLDVLTAAVADSPVELVVVTRG